MRLLLFKKNKKNKFSSDQNDFLFKLYLLSSCFIFIMSLNVAGHLINGHMGDREVQKNKTKTKQHPAAKLPITQTGFEPVTISKQGLKKKKMIMIHNKQLRKGTKTIQLICGHVCYCRSAHLCCPARRRERSPARQ